MTRRKKGKLTPLSHKDRLVKAVRNEKRKRIPKAVKWEKEHVARGPVTYTKRKSKARIKREEAKRRVMEALRNTPNVEEVK